jgi:hypothetical protein
MVEAAGRGGKRSAEGGQGRGSYAHNQLTGAKDMESKHFRAKIHPEQSRSEVTVFISTSGSAILGIESHRMKADTHMDLDALRGVHSAIGEAIAYAEAGDAALAVLT